MPIPKHSGNVDRMMWVIFQYKSVRFPRHMVIYHAIEKKKFLVAHAWQELCAILSPLHVNVGPGKFFFRLHRTLSYVPEDGPFGSKMVFIPPRQHCWSFLEARKKIIWFFRVSSLVYGSDFAYFPYICRYSENMGIWLRYACQATKRGEEQ